MIEYRTTDGNRIEVAANGHISTPKKVDLRSLGCPDWLASKVEGAREVRRAAPAAPAPPKVTAVTDAAGMLRRAAQAMARPFINQVKRDLPYPAPYDYATLRMHLEKCSELTECAYSIADTVDDLLDSWPDDDSRAKKRDLHRAFVMAHRGSIEALSDASIRLVQTMAHLTKVTNKMMSKGNGGDDN